MTKFKKRKEEQKTQSENGSTAEFAGQSNTNAQNIRNNSSMVERFGKIFKKKKKPTTITTRSRDENVHPASPATSSSSDNDDNRTSDDALDRLDNLECDEEMSPIDDDIAQHRGQRKQKRPMKNRNKLIGTTTHVIDTDQWTQRKTCCGYVYVNEKLDAILIETNAYSTCLVHAKKLPLITSPAKNDMMKLPTAIKSLPPKKQHFLRQCIIEAAPPAQLPPSPPTPQLPPSLSIVQIPIEQSAPIDYSKSSAIEAARVLNNLHKIRNDAGKVAKKAPKKKLAELNAAKNLIKLCTSSKLAQATLLAEAAAAVGSTEQKSTEQIGGNEHNENKNITNTVAAPAATVAEPKATTKYSDNSSDSGYEETLHDATQLNQIAKIGATRPIILSNGVKLHVKPENLVLAANLAGVSQTAIQTTQVSSHITSAVIFMYLKTNSYWNIFVSSGEYKGDECTKTPTKIECHTADCCCQWHRHQYIIDDECTHLQMHLFSSCW